MAERLPDNVWLKILSFLSSDNLILIFSNIPKNSHLMLHTRLFHIIADKSLWTNISYHARGGKNKQSSANDLRKMVKFLGPHVQEIKICGTDKCKFLIRESFLHSLQRLCTRLKVLNFEYCCLNYHEAPLRKLPRSLRCLHLINIVWSNFPFIRSLQASPYFKLKNRLPYLEVVIILILIFFNYLSDNIAFFHESTDFQIQITEEEKCGKIYEVGKYDLKCIKTLVKNPIIK